MGWRGPARVSRPSAKTVSAAREAGAQARQVCTPHPPRVTALGHVTGREQGQLLRVKTKLLTSRDWRVWTGQEGRTKLPYRVAFVLMQAV